MSYVPPHLRNRKEKPKTMKETKIVEAEFPAFVPNHKPMNNFKGPSFLSKITEVTVVDTAAPTKEITIPTTRSRYSRYDRQYDDYYNDDNDNEELQPDDDVLQTTEKTPDDGWQTVERKIRIKRDKVQEAMDNDDAPIEDEEGESAWDEQPEEYETYWDERRH
jgi:hypothetical protein